MADDKEVRIDVTANDKASAVITDAAKNAEAAMKKLTEEEKKLDKVRQEAERERQKQRETRKSHLQQLEAEWLLVEEGADAHERYKLKLQGLDAATIDIIQAERQRLAVLKGLQQVTTQTAVVAGRTGFQNTKASAEFFGTIANFAGGGQVGVLAMQIGGLTEKTAQFNEIAKQGGAAADALKVGLAAAAGAIGFQVGKQIGNAVFQVERWNDELERANKQLDKLESKRLTALSKSFAELKDSLEFDDNSEATVQAEIEKLGNSIRGLEMNAQSARKAIADMHQQGVQGNIFSTDDPTLSGADKLAAYLETFTGEFKASLAAKEKGLLADEATLELYRKQKEELEDMLGKDKEREQLRKERDEAEQSSSYLADLQDQLSELQSELNGTTNITELIKNTIAADRDAAIELLDEIEATKKAIQEKEEKTSEKQQAEKLVDTPSETKGFKQTATLQAMESRLMVGGRGGNDVQDQIEKNTKEVANAAKEQRMLLAESKAILKQIADKNTVSLEVVGA